MGARFSRWRGPERTIRSLSTFRRSLRDVKLKLDDALEAKKEGDYGRASHLYEEAAEFSIHNREHPGLAASHYLEAAVCAQIAFEESKTTSVNATNAQATAASVGPGGPTSPPVGVDEVLRLLEESATQYTKGKRFPQAAGVRKRMALLYEEELEDNELAIKFYQMASQDFVVADMINNAVECDLSCASVAFETDPLLSLETFKTAAAKLIKKRQYASANPIVYKIVLITALVYDVKVAQEARDSYVKLNRSFMLNLDLRKLEEFLDALVKEDSAAVGDLIEEARDPWAREIMIRMQKENYMTDELNLT